MFDHWVRHLIGDGAPLHEVGGKAVGLDRLLGHGFPVPPVRVVTADAYLAFIEEAGLRQHLDRLRDSDVPPPDLIEAERARVDAAFLHAPMPSGIEDSIRKATSELLSLGPLAVRSSATAEDLASASFAGQYRSYLEIGTEEAVLDAVRMCWASLWDPSARAYRQQGNVPEGDLSMGVVLQAMAPAEWAGVMFTRDPLGDPDVARVEAVRGLGEALVSGKVTPAVFRVDRATLEVRGSSQAAQPGFIEDLVRMGIRVERRLGSPQDIEWAHDGRRLLLLQSRPITHHEPLAVDDDGFDTAPEPGHTYTPHGLAEMLPGVLPPLLWTINAPMLDNAFRELFADLDIPTPEVSGPLMTVGRFRGRAALNLSVLREAAASMPGGSAAEVERQYLGRVLSDHEEPDRAVGNPFTRAVAGLRAVRVRKRIEDEVALLVDATNFAMALDVDLESLSTNRLLRYRARVRDLAWRGYEAEVAASAGAAAAYRSLEIALERWVGTDDAALWAQRITAGPSMADQPGANCAGELWSLYTAGVARGPAYASVLGGPIDEAPQRLETLGPPGMQFVDAVNRTSRHFGSMAVYGGTTWDEDIRIVWDCIATMARTGADVPNFTPAQRVAVTRESRDAAFDELVRHLRGSWKWRLTRIFTGQIVDVRRRLLRKLAVDAAMFLELRERSKAALLILGGEEHRIIFESSRRLAASGHIAGESDVLFLADSELTDMLLGGEPVATGELVRRREAHEASLEAEPLPETFEGLPGVDVFEPAEGDSVEGWAASSGTVRGRVRVLRELADGASLEPGDVIVAHSTDPSWTPLFLIAGAIVLEKGGPLSHAAIVAREFGLPAVLNVRGATQLFSTGDEVEVDGTTGLVTRVLEEAA
jgi:pyruvate,water dikinase